MTSHASRWISAPGEVFEFYMIYNKKPLTLQEQVNKLKSRGLLIDDKPLAISNIISPNSDLKRNILSIIGDGGNLLNLQEMGFPKNWKFLDVWK